MNKMRFITGALALVLMAGTAYASDSGLPDWATPLAGTKFTAIDGSSIVMERGDGSFSLTRTSPGGASQSESFAFLADRLGTVSADGGHVVGFFRVIDNSVEAQYADGRSESLFANGGGGLSLALHGTESACLSWYPADHVFSVADRRAAVAAYAASLGIDQGVKSKPSPAQTCAPETKHVTASAHYVIPDTAPAGPVVALVPVAVRTSDVHAVPEPAVAKVADPPPAPVLALAQPVKIDAPTRTVTAPPVPAATPQLADADSAAQLGHGASDCLHVESNGSSLGFRNHCLFNVEFVYCLQSKDDPRAICNIETHTGNVSANGFTPLLSDANIKMQDAEHDFRWVACSGTPKDVTAYLDSAEPPSGRCVRLNAS